MACTLTAEKLIELIDTQLDVRANLDTALSDLNMDSLDVIELAMAVEDACDIEVDEALLRDVKRGHPTRGHSRGPVGVAATGENHRMNLC